MNLEVKLPSPCGEIILKNPIMPSAATMGNVIEYNDYFDLSALGALIPNSMFIDSGSPTRNKKMAQTENGFISCFSKNNISIFKFAETILPSLPWQTTPVIIDMKARDIDQMEQLAAVINKLDQIAGVEINLNCPYGVADAPYWHNLDILKELIRRVRAAAKDKLVIAKAPGGFIPAAQIAQACEEAGADAITSFCNFGGTKVDIYSRKLICGVNGEGGFSGPGIKPMCLQQCHQMINAVKIPIIGNGGISKAEDVLEYIMLGATAVQIGSANLSRPDFIYQLTKDLEVLMDKLEIHSLDEIRGCATM